MSKIMCWRPGGIPDICHKHQEKISCVEKFVHMIDCHVEKFLHVENICFVAIYAVLSQILFCRNLRAFMWRKI